MSSSSKFRQIFIQSSLNTESAEELVNKWISEYDPLKAILHQMIDLCSIKFRCFVSLSFYAVMTSTRPRWWDRGTKMHWYIVMIANVRFDSKTQHNPSIPRPYIWYCTIFPIDFTILHCWDSTGLGTMFQETWSPGRLWQDGGNLYHRWYCVSSKTNG